MGIRTRAVPVAVGFALLTTVTVLATVVGAPTKAGAVSGDITTVAGAPTVALAAPATAQHPTGLAYAADTLYVADETVVRRGTSPQDIVAGTGTRSHSGDGGPATAAALAGVSAIAVDGTGNIYIVESDTHQIRMVDAGGVITTVAGNGTSTFSGDGPATTVGLDPAGIATDGSTLYIADRSNNRIRALVGGDLTTVAGTGQAGAAGDGGPATAAQLDGPNDVAVAANGDLVVADRGNQRIRRVHPGGNVTLVASGFAVTNLAIDPVDLVLFSDGGATVWTTNGGPPSPLAGSGTPGFSGDNGPAGAARLDGATDVVTGGATAIAFVADANNNRVRRISSLSVIDTVAGNGSATSSTDPATTQSATFGRLEGVAASSTTTFVSDPGGHRVRAITSTGNVTTLAGSGRWDPVAPNTGTGVAATAVDLSEPRDLALISSVLWINEWGPMAPGGGDRVRRVSVSGGNITTVWAPGTSESLLDVAGVGTTAFVSYIAGPDERRIRRVGSANDADIYSVVLAPGDPEPTMALAATPDGSIAFAGPHCQIWRIDTSGANPAPIAGDGTCGSGGDGGAVGDAALAPIDIAVDAVGRTWITEAGRIRLVEGAPPEAAIDRIRTASGNGTPGFDGEAVPADTATVDPGEIGLDPSGNAVFTNALGRRVRRIEAGGLPPGSPKSLQTQSGPGQVRVEWNAPAVNSSGITGYTITAEPGGASCTWTTGPLTCTVTGLTDGTPYTFRATATNAAGTSLLSAPTAPVTAGAPAAPTGVTAIAGAASATVTWLAPDPPSTLTTTSYTVTALPGGQTCPWTHGPLSCTIGGLTPGRTYRTVVRAANEAGEGAASARSDQFVPTASVLPRFHPVVPERILDSRDGTGGWTTVLGPGESRNLHVAGIGSVPAGATAIQVNVTATEATHASYLTLFPSGGTNPVAANLVFARHQTLPAHAIVKLGSDGDVSIFNQRGEVHVVVDLVGWYDDGADATGDEMTAVPPARLLDSRTDVGGWSGAIGPDAVRILHVADPGAVTSVTVNITVTEPTAASFVTTFPAGGFPPLAASIVFGRGQTTSNLTTVGVDPNGDIAIYNQLGTVHLVVDQVAESRHRDPATRGLVAIAPTRILDSRQGIGTTTAPWGPDTTRAVPAGGVGPIPSDAKGVVVNLTATGASSGTFLTAWPGSGARPSTANLSAGPGPPRGNLVVVPLAEDGTFSLYNQRGSVDLVADAVAYLVDEPGPLPDDHGALLSPTYFVGNEVSGYAPTASCVDPRASCAGTQPNMWAAIQGPYEQFQNGDPLDTKCATDTTTIAVCNVPANANGAQNALYRTTGQLWAVDVPASAVGQPVTVQIYDATHQAGCPTAGAANGGNSYLNESIPNCTSGGEANTGGQMNLSYELFDSDGSDASIATDPSLSLAIDGSEGPGEGRCVNGSVGYKTISAAENRDYTAGGTVATMHNKWWTLCTFVPTRTGIHPLRVKSSAIPGLTDTGGGWNAYSVRAVGTTGLRVYAVDDASIWHTSNGTSRVYLAEVAGHQIGRDLVFDFFDPGDGSGASAFTLQILGPPGCDGPCPSRVPGSAATSMPCSYNATASATPGPATANSSSTCTITTKNAGASSGVYNGKWLRIRVPIPLDYTCTADCWWTARYNFASSTVNDRTTFSAHFEDP